MKKKDIKNIFQEWTKYYQQFPARPTRINPDITSLPDLNPDKGIPGSSNPDNGDRNRVVNPDALPTSNHLPENSEPQRHEAHFEEAFPSHSLPLDSSSANLSLQKQSAIFSNSAHLPATLVLDNNHNSDAQIEKSDTRPSTEYQSKTTSQNSNLLNASKNMSSTLMNKSDLPLNKADLSFTHSYTKYVSHSIASSLSKTSSLLAYSPLSKQSDEIPLHENKSNIRTNESAAQRAAIHSADVLGQNLHLHSSAVLGNLSPLLNSFRTASHTLNTGSLLNSSSSTLQNSNTNFLRALTQFPGLSLLTPNLIHTELGQGLSLFNNIEGRSHLIPFQPNSSMMASLIFKFPEYASLFYSILIGELAAQMIQRKRDEKERLKRKRLNKYGEVIRTEATASIDVDIHENREDAVEEIETWIRINNQKETLRFWE